MTREGSVSIKAEPPGGPALPEFRLNKKLVIFDLDGTLVDAYAAITLSVNATLERFGYPAQKPDLIRSAVGAGDERLLAVFLPPSRIKAALKFYRSHHAKTLMRHTRWLPYARRVLVRIRQSGIKTAIASNRPTRFTRIILRSLSARPLFDLVLCADRLRYRKPAPLILNRIMRKFSVPRHRTLYVGDMVTDIETGRRAGVDTAAVATGSSTPAELKKSRPTYLCRRIDQIMAICYNQ